MEHVVGTSSPAARVAPDIDDANMWGEVLAVMFHLLMTERAMGVARARGLAGISRSLFRYESRRRGDGEALTGRMMAIAAQKRRYGYRRIHMLLQREGYLANHKRIWRLVRSVRERRRKRIAGVERRPLLLPTGPNLSWSMNFDSDRLPYGRRCRCLNVVDDYTRECLAIGVDTSLPGLRVQQVLEQLEEMRGLPASITVDNGPEFAGEEKPVGTDGYCQRTPSRASVTCWQSEPNDTAD
ncbi:transposase [Burkholderia sp. Ac-20345]|uniref:DDE-type integrase/transposase/recombinase n=1 Tax=Burkholderia sp. Ac-20345 TaxID=2703891 RepID=UPI001F12096F|nr:DDE-type integrase/transposase/recombinase [Burkholderia sp. Ac-20345]MBN3781384.1 transposase [Burkholderia sp. Ac-20345]